MLNISNNKHVLITTGTVQYTDKILHDIRTFILCDISTLQLDSTQKHPIVQLYIRKNKHAKEEQCKKKRGKWPQMAPIITIEPYVGTNRTTIRWHKALVDV